MTAVTARLVLLLSFASACVAPGRAPKAEQAASGESDPPGSEQTAAEAAGSELPELVEQLGPLEIVVGERLLEPSAFAPSREIGMTDEPQTLGWSKATGEFVVCVPSGGAVCNRCDFHRVGGERERLGVGEDCGAERVTSGELDARLRSADVRIENGAWAYGAEVVLVIATRQGPPDSYGIPRGVIEIGARLRADDAAVGWIDRIEHCNRDTCAPEVHVDAVAPSPDGRTIAVLAHTFAGEFTDTYPLRLLDAETVAAAAYGAAEIESAAALR
jgi:hypothetical protein